MATNRRTNFEYTNLRYLR